MNARTLAAAALAVVALTAAPAAADDITMGTPTSQVYVAPPPEPFVYSETITTGPAELTPAPELERGVVTYRHRTRRAVRAAGLVYLASGGAPVSHRVAATFR